MRGASYSTTAPSFLRRAPALTLAVDRFAYPAFASAQPIVVDGGMQTAVEAAGKVVNVMTGTVPGVNAFNSFSKFSVEQGITANLFLPGGTANLSNIVRQQRTDIYGVLNAIEEGASAATSGSLIPTGSLSVPAAL